MAIIGNYHCQEIKNSMDRVKGTIKYALKNKMVSQNSIGYALKNSMVSQNSIRY